MQNKDSMLIRAQEIETSQPAEAAQLFTSVLALDPANLTAHNALERLQAPQRYGRWMLVNCVIDPRDDIYRFLPITRSLKILSANTFPMAGARFRN